MEEVTVLRPNGSQLVCIKNYVAPCGTLIIGSIGEKICLCDWEGSKHRFAIDRRLVQSLRTIYKVIDSRTNMEAARQLDEYFAGKRTGFTLPLLFIGTEFQRKVWNEMMTIPYGETISYADLAERCGKPKAARAVAKACAANAIAIFAPCHRVTGAEGPDSTGYAGGSDAREFLLGLEAKGKLLLA